MLTAISAFLIDAIIGDPNSKWHPVVLMGKLISFLERAFYRPEDSDGKKFAMGSMLVIIVLLISYDAAAALMHFSYYLPGWGSAMVGALILSFMISPKSLAKAGKGIYALLLLGNLEEARQKVGWIVGRDTDKLSEAEIARATVETIAENTVDGIIAPLFFFALGGVPLAVLYRAANTMDSMIGYKNDRYLLFGRCAARLDDVLNFIPSRLAALLLIAAAHLCGEDGKNAYRIWRRDRRKHASPNSAQTESAVAGALRLRLAGSAQYFGVVHEKPYIGDDLRPIEPNDILRAHRLLYVASTLMLLICLIGRICIDA